MLGIPPIVLEPFKTSSPHPAHVQMIARVAEFALWRYRVLGFAPPAVSANGARSGPLRIRLVAMCAFRGMTSPERDHIEVSNQLVGTPAMMTVAHEIFHRVQCAYNATPFEDRWFARDDALDVWMMLFEGGARFAEELIADGVNRYASDAERWFTSRRRPLFRSRADDGGVAGASYEAALFRKYVSEQHGAPLLPEPAELAQGNDDRARRWGPSAQHFAEATTHRLILEGIRPDPPRQGQQACPHALTVDHLRRVRARLDGVGTFDRFVVVELPPRPPFAGMAVPLIEDTTWDNYLCALAMNGQASDDRRFEFREQPQFRGAAAFRVEVSGGRTLRYEDLPASGLGSLELDGPGQHFGLGRDFLAARRVERLGDNILRALLGRPPPPDLAPMLKPYDMIAHRVLMPEGEACRLLRIVLVPDGSLLGRGADGRSTIAGAIVQVILLGPGGRMVAVIRHDLGASPGDEAFRRTIACQDVREVPILVCSRQAGGTFSLSLSRPEDEPVLFASRWNAPSGRNLTLDPYAHAWTWLSPDLDVVRDLSMTHGDGRPGVTLETVIRLALRNIGDRRGVSTGARVHFAWRPWRGGKRGAAWSVAGPIPVGRLASVESIERDFRGGRMTVKGRHFGRRLFTLTPRDAQGRPVDLLADDYMLCAVVTQPTALHNEPPLVVLGSSRPVSQAQLRAWGWRQGLADPEALGRLGASVSRGRPLRGAAPPGTLRVAPAPLPQATPAIRSRTGGPLR